MYCMYGRKFTGTIMDEVEDAASNKRLKKLTRLAFKTLTWGKLKSLGLSKTVHTSFIWLILVPLVLKLLSLMPADSHINVLGVKVAIGDLSLPFSWKVFYCSALFFAIASLLFAIFCPHQIKHPDILKYWRESGREPLQINHDFIFILKKPKSFLWPLNLSALDLDVFYTEYLMMKDYDSDKDFVLRNGAPSKRMLKRLYLN